MKRLEESEGIVLKRHVLLGKNVLVTVFTKEYGKIALLVPNLRSKSSRRSSLLQTGNYVDLSWIAKQESARYLKTITLISALASLKDSLSHVQSLYTLLFVIDRLLPLEEKEIEVYEHIKRFLRNVSVTSNTSHLLYETLLNIIKILGYGRHDHKNMVSLLRYIQELIDDRIPYGTI